MKHRIALASLVVATPFLAPPRLTLAVETKMAPHSSVMEMIEIAPATYRTGDDNGYWDAKPAHEVKIRRAYRIAVNPVSNAQYEVFDPQHRATRTKLETLAGDDDPVRFVTWQQAANYCFWLGERTGKSYRLPSEAEWENAFRTRAADLKLGREVENWCADWYGRYSTSAITNPRGAKTGDFRVVRGGSWRAAKDQVSLARLGALPDDSNAIIGFRLIEALPLRGEFTKVPNLTPVHQGAYDWNPRIDMAQPYFAEPIPYVRIPEGSTGPLFSKHNHVPSIAALNNGDLMAIWYSTVEEWGRELVVLASRLRRGQSEWDAPTLFWDTPGRNDHCPVLWADQKGTLYHFNSIAAEGGWEKLGLTLRTSRDNGRTWTKMRWLQVERRFGNQAISGVFRAPDGALYLPCDENPERKGGSILHVSRDDGKTWMPINRDAPRPTFEADATGAWIAGIHAGVDALADGTLVAVGREDDIDGKMPMSISRDDGQSWTYAATPFPGIGGGQRPVLRRLKEGPMLLVSFTPGSRFRNAQGEEFTGKGMFAALSYDGGKTWPHRRLLTDGVTRTMNGQAWTKMFTMDATHAEPGGYLAVIQAPDGMIELISSGVHYRFNAAWLQQTPAVEPFTPATSQGDDVM